MDSLFHDLQGFVHPRWCRTSSININSSVQIQQNNLLQQNNLKFHHKNTPSCQVLDWFHQQKKTPK